MEREGTRIGVAVRVRPLLPEELKAGKKNNFVAVDASDQTVTVSLPDQSYSKTFKFDLVFDESTEQSEVFDRCGVPFLLKKFVAGFNVTIFAYGQTGSGKTFTMEGYQYRLEGPEKLPRVVPNSDDPARLGVVPRCIQTLFQELKSVQRTVEGTISVTFLQLYKERIYDLLNPAQAFHPSAPGLKLRWNKTDQFYVEDLSVHRCETFGDVMRLYHSGLKSKVMASHLLNNASSRSHCVLTVSYESLDKEDGSGVVSRLHLVDLAGSERTALTGNEGEALKDSIDINKSLFTLRQVISQLAGKEGSYVPYRDSKLTSLLKQSIGGNSYCLMLACVAPADAYYEENLSTLAYATKASFISNEPVRNIDAKTKLVRGLKREVAELKAELAKAYEQIELLSNLKKQAPEVRSVSTASAPLSREETLRPTTTSGGTQTLPSFESFAGSEGQFSLSPELMTEKLNDSVNLIRELIAANRKLRESLTAVTQDKERLEEDVHHVSR